MRRGLGRQVSDRDFRMLHRFLFASLIAMTSTAIARERIPTTYEAGHFFVHLHTQDGRSLRLVVDSGGAGGSGLYVLEPKAVKRLQLPEIRCSSFDSETPLYALPADRWKGIPDAPGTPCGATALAARTGLGQGDGNLGAGYLPAFTWTFDYPARALWLESPDWRAPAGMRGLPMFFPRNARGQRAAGLPRIQLDIAGQTLSFLLDTGATAKPTAEGLTASGIETFNGFGVTSYITTSILERWHREHPEWRMVNNGDALMGSRIIELPALDVAGWRIGPVWFTERPDGAFDETSGISQYMDAEVVGAIGANVWQRFTMTLDYPHATVWLSCSHCEGAEH